VLQLPDVNAGPATPVRPARPGVLLIWVASPAGPRSCLIADLIRRTAERHHWRASVWQPEPVGWEALNIYPAEVCAGPPDPLDVAVTATGQRGVSAAHLLRPGLARPQAPDLTGLDPLALRLALFRHSYRDEVVLTRDDLEASDEALRGWRGLVSHWARSPSKPICARYAGDFLGALDDDLDAPAALRTLAALAADQEIPDGSKFETFAHLDRFVGLDLAREVGR
jgi:hypothetical protein